MKKVYIQPICIWQEMGLVSLITLSAHQEVGNKEQASRQWSLNDGWETDSIIPL